MEYSVINRMASSSSSSYRSGNSMEKEVERSKEPVGMEDTMETKHFGYFWIDTVVNSQRLYHHAQGLHGSKPDDVPAVKTEVAQCLISNPESTSNC